MSGRDLTSLSDDEIMSMSSPAEAGIAPLTEEDRAAALAATGTEGSSDSTGGTGAVEGAATGDAGEGSTNGETSGVETSSHDTGAGDAGDGADADAGVTTGSAEGTDTGQSATGDGDQAPAGEKPAGDAAQDGSTAAAPGGEKPAGQTSEPDPNLDYKADYEEIMKPFKANGKTITLKDASEVRQLMQMGANYTKKLQELAPHRKTLLMLQSNQIDESKLDYLIALDKRDPEAIKKLIKDSGIDPLEIDTSKDSTFKAGTHIISDEDANFKTALDELAESDEGKETLVEIEERFDPVSKNELWKSPDILSAIHSQRESGVYALITEEMDRRKVLGQIPQNIPFLQAYKLVGDDLAAAAQGGKTGSTTSSGDQGGTSTGQAGQPAPVVVATRTAVPKPAATNDDKAAAASTSRGSSSAKLPPPNPLAMSDEDFLKSANLVGRV
jgi:hypothetical protein